MVKIFLVSFFFHIVFLLLNIDRGYSIEPPEPQLGGSSVYPRSTLRANKKTITISHLKIIILSKWKSVYCISKIQIRFDCGYSLEVVDFQHRKQRRTLLERLRIHKVFAVEQIFVVCIAD